MRLIPVNSSNVAAFGYDIDERVLYVQFNSGTFYKYLDVSADDVVSVIFDPESQGKAFNAVIKGGGFAYTPLDTAEVERLRV